MRGYRYLQAFAALSVSGTALASTADDLPLIEAAVRSGRLVQAQTMLERLPADMPQTRELAVIRAQLTLAQGQYAEAEQAFIALAGEEGGDCRVVAGLGASAVAREHADRAIAYMEKAVEKCLPDWRIWSGLGRAYDLRARWSDSGLAYNRAITIGGRAPALLNDLAVSLLKQRRYAEAKALLEQAFAADPANLRFANNLDIAAAAMGEQPVRRKTDNAARWAERLSNAGYAALLAGRRGDARAWLSQSVAAAPIYPEKTAKILASLGSTQ
ncbi:MAG: hypothetical protein P0Y64_14045 [Candidatus Sphingomonas colombiensis]|nr:tetratricopeptide repeat protein [Sphingomonas sp.]WEK42502.1 MAG: hypothetical protein P0Y64_14045 [Sphingomonas sp.]